MALGYKSRRGGAFRSVFGFCAVHWRRQPGRVVFMLFAVLLSTLADVLTPLFSGRLVDAVVSGRADDSLAWDSAMAAFAWLMALSAGAVLLRHATFTAIIGFTLRSMSDIAADAFSRIQRFSSDWHANSFAGSTVRKVTRGMWALDLLNDTVFVALFPSLVMLIGSTVLMTWHWPMMGLLVGVGSICFVMFTAIMALRYVAPMASMANSWDTKLGGSLADAVTCNAVVKAFGGESREETRLSWVLQKWQDRTRRTWTRGTLNGSLQAALLMVLRGGVLGLALWLWSAGKASPGDITFVLTAFFILQGYLREIGMHIRNLQRSVNDMEELVFLHGQPLGVVDVAGAKPVVIERGEIEFDRVSFHYGNHFAPLYKDFSVVIQPGEKVGLVGHSGSGKTTFIKLIQRLHDVNGGAIRIDGQDIALVAQTSLRQQIAIVQQEPILFHRSLAENIAYARPSASEQEIETAARLASAHGFIEALPKGYGTLVGERGIKLSGGERQRIAIARAFLADAPILILDEATSSLDSESEMLIQEAMERLMQGRTTLVVAHRLSTVRALDRLLVFDHGRIAEEGTHESLIRMKPGIYRGLFERQALELTKGMVFGE
ncbi:ATP-binding cassette domain-containing protein [Agrobacterium vitis]|uniref:ATP-binding cassette domain-containing protein n=1 Tax=Agrobacterium vitis TaxID=373 RepID=A0ABD6GED8_AGRVI|nr:ABC transporter ATP-binding protein [Agrobacterium vitis]MUO79006.1 ATP-binding cassette domain-containing protein [Agrobacterium vitis]MUO94569.1 ATP-binding cassette domain-containing protein [Agrobacterium vitis]MUP06228.1 ATP-binding cassette domain-containing protein [Agrobacterium vitis]MUZ82325.1 ATP-binding cassette domain-containing protein [Agrobacterium vitis]MVA11315.1 ATP-binding cassette domain-containing protein [Agrobacterium vitis]